jgi:hypothetical protein
MDDRFTEADHERALRAGRNMMAAEAKSSAGKPAGKPVTLRTLGLIIRDGVVLSQGGFREKRLGSLTGARAQLGDVGKVHNVGAAVLTLMPVFALTTRKQAMAYVVFPDGTVHEKKLDGKSAVRAGEREVMKFNALAGSR